MKEGKQVQLRFQRLLQRQDWSVLGRMLSGFV
jgi:hypothetical protein